MIPEKNDRNRQQKKTGFFEDVKRKSVENMIEWLRRKQSTKADIRKAKNAWDTFKGANGF